MSYQHFQALSAISLIRSHKMLMLSMILDEDYDDLPLLLYRCHQSNLHNIMNIEQEEVIPHLIQDNLSRTFDLFQRLSASGAVPLSQPSSDPFNFY
jgi:hypothetical protein